jgi:hypothetical protein
MKVDGRGGRRVKGTWRGFDEKGGDERERENTELLKSYKAKNVVS